MNNLGEAPQRILFKDLPNARDEQFLMRRLSVLNWGTFSRIHTCHFAEDGSLLLGPSGAGKSTLLDAISAMTVPPRKVRFNAAADEGGQKGHDRTITTYLRGAWASKGDVESRDSAKQFLRPSQAVAAIALEYGNRLGRTLTLVRVMWLTGAASADVNHAYLVAEGSFDLKLLAKLDGDMRKLRAHVEHLEGVTPHKDFAHFQDHWCRIMGIEDPTALELLHKAQSTKSVGDLNTFLRQFMLEEPETFEKASAFVLEFVELEEAHKAVVSARQQIEILSPARTAYAEHAQQQEQLELKRSLRDAAPAFVQHIGVGLLQDEIASLTRELESADSQMASTGQRVSFLQEQLHSLNEQCMAAGGSDILGLERRIDELVGQRKERSRNKDRVALACRDLDWSMPEDAQGYAALYAQANALVQGAEQREATRDEQRDALKIQNHLIGDELKSLRAEVEALEKSPSNIPSSLRDLREQMCQVLGIPLSRVVFVGELIQVLSDHTEWRPAIEKFLGGFGKDMIVHPDFHKKVAQWIDRTNTGKRLVYHAVNPDVASAKRLPRSEASVINKLQLKDHPFSGWVYKELLERFDYQCVNSPAELLADDQRLTINGQIRHNKGRIEKDDRFDWKDPRNWTLGFDSREKLAAFRQAAQDKATTAAENIRQLDELDKQRKQDMLRKSAAETLINFNWISIDDGALVEQIASQEIRLESLRKGNTTLADLQGQKVSVTAELEAANTLLSELKIQARKDRESMKDRELDLESARVLAGSLASNHRDALRARFPENWSPTLKTLSDEVQRVVNALNDELEQHGHAKADLARKVVSAFDAVLRGWKEECGDLQANLESAPDFFARLQRLEEDGLPEHEAKFRNLLNQLSTQRLAELQTHMDSGRSMIRQKLEEVNDQLYPVPYNPDTFIRIVPVDLKLKEVDEFKGLLSPIFANQHLARGDESQAEAQFERLRSVVKFLSDDEPEAKRKRTLVLDIRQHVEFVGEEVYRSTGKQANYIDGSGGLSGGQRQKLTATCLAAALRYKLGGVDGGVPQYAPVVLDEAFTKTDPEFTRICLKIFKELGFQLIVATPMKGVQTIEEFIGGAVYVSIKDRKESSVCQIDYITEDQRLNLSQAQREEALEGEDA